MYQLLVDNETPSFAANVSKGMKWQELDMIMRSKGFQDDTFFLGMFFCVFVREKALSLVAVAFLEDCIW